MVVKKKRGRPKARSASTDKNAVECKECDNSIREDDPAMECDICKTFVCLDCTKLPAEVYNYLVDHEVDVPFICKPCKTEIPKVRELMGLRNKYKELNEEVTKLKTDLATQELKINNYEVNQKTLSDRLEALENKPANTEIFPNLLEANQPQQLRQFVQNHVRPVLQTEISEYDQIQAIKLNLVCSGIKESDLTDDAEVEAEDRTSFINLIKDEFNIIPDIEKVERCGPKKKISAENPVLKPRLLKIYMKDQRTRKLILSKAVTLRESASENTKQNVFIRPDQTSNQQKESKNLRDSLKEVRRLNPEKTFKIYRGAIKEMPVVQVVQEETQD